MRLLLDTNIFVWALDDLQTLAPAAQAMLQDGENELFVSMASLWEIAAKIGTGKLESDTDWEACLPRMGAALLPIAADHTREVARLPKLQADPFDRMLIAQARCEDLILVTRDKHFADYDITVMPA